ncbi:hypothetical protein Palpr_0875 [Paludibacter propionicigenes WB4]|uniref:Uncharacterized protein n=1 Tax=Paludibacter propionicigenes (strain DSM 17365 / JCM 13257 / WB4) TaxID=694427 RepID=E4T2T3_PALPW|nr:hypothetical protein [Paludibacter propionicigenes]ADQ79027.1 hypothetical protein Palpr_0875 [Paludibacter propionicigenes WB4]
MLLSLKKYNFNIKFIVLNYYVNKNAQPNGDHEVHTAVCLYLPTLENRKYLGIFRSCSDALAYAKETYPQSNGCYYCCRECHTR